MGCVSPGKEVSFSSADTAKAQVKTCYSADASPAHAARLLFTVRPIQVGLRLATFVIFQPSMSLVAHTCSFTMFTEIF